MAWPCITRACCINRFWTELDKADIAVPLVFTKYSDVADVHHLPQRRQPRRAAESQAPPASSSATTTTEPPAASGKDASAASVTRQDFQAWKVRPEPSCKPRNEYQPSAASFIPETQYQKDYKAWPIPKKHDHPWIPKADLAPAGGAGKGESETGVEKSEIEEKLQEKEVKEPARRDKSRERKEVEKKAEEAQVCADVQQKKKGRAVADALNRHIKETMTTSSSYRTEFKAYKDVKPVKPIKATSQYKPPAEETSLETSYSATFRGEQVKAQAADNKLIDRRRIRSLYSEPGKEPAKTDKGASRTRPKKKAATTTSGKVVKKAKEKQLAGSASAKKKEAAAVASSEPPGDGGVSKKSKEISNRLAEAKQ
ncbi:microtubule-associated protein 6 homolog isoform X1 [Entelurus aequoreus]|uniref:microtubule-associated protein 6 homolog isoform X1 n=1 Tax=Entelurus aequoreus TaxID=161455 RepID=UPI002B1DBA22|nr:microtubule-associated protein 6 homolog isoform X1 [Entelurus aequoreus]